MVAQTTPRNSSASRHTSNNDIWGQSLKLEVTSQPSLPFLDKTCGCSTPLHLRKSRIKSSSSKDVSTKVQLADIRTKPLGRVTFERLRAQLGLEWIA